MHTMRKLCLLSLFLQIIPAYPSGAETSKPTHGTVNIIVANGTDMVVVVDSMLSSGLQRHPSGTKLFRVDDKTVLAIAGFYSAPGARQIHELDAFIPQIATNLLKYLSTQPVVENTSSEFESKAQSIAGFFAAELTNHIDASIAAYAGFNFADFSNALVLTVAGYDLDGRLKVAEITLVPRQLNTGVTYVPLLQQPSPNQTPCESAGAMARYIAKYPQSQGGLLQIRTVDNHFFCELAGIGETAERLLSSPELAIGDFGIKRYAEAQRNGQLLTIEELRKLAGELESETAARQRLYKTFWVGGTPKFAVLSNGHVIEAPAAPSVPSREGSELNRFPLINISVPCNNSKQQAISLSPGYNVSGFSITNCTQPIDSLIIHDSLFTNSTIVYNGAGPLLFAKSNKVINSKLILGPSIDVSTPEVKELICSFPWVSIVKGDTEVHKSCKNDDGGVAHP